MRVAAVLGVDPIICIAPSLTPIVASAFAGPMNMSPTKVPTMSPMKEPANEPRRGPIIGMAARSVVPIAVPMAVPAAEPCCRRPRRPDSRRAPARRPDRFRNSFPLRSQGSAPRFATSKPLNNPLLTFAGLPIPSMPNALCTSWLVIVVPIVSNSPAPKPLRPSVLAGLAHQEPGDVAHMKFWSSGRELHPRTARKPNKASYQADRPHLPPLAGSSVRKSRPARPPVSCLACR